MWSNRHLIRSPVQVIIDAEQIVDNNRFQLGTGSLSHALRPAQHSKLCLMQPSTRSYLPAVCFKSHYNFFGLISIFVFNIFMGEALRWKWPVYQLIVCLFPVRNDDDDDEDEDGSGKLSQR